MEIGLPSSAIHENTTVASLTTGLNNFACFPTGNHSRQPIRSQRQQLSSPDNRQESVASTSPFVGEAVSMFELVRPRLTFAFAGCVMFICNLLVANVSGNRPPRPW